MIYPYDIQGLTPIRENEWTIPYFPSSEEEAPSTQHESWNIVNEGAGGYCLEYRQDKIAQVQVGELIGIRRHQPQETNDWGIGVVRWMKFTNTRTLHIGVEMIAPKVAAIGIRGAAQTNTPHQRCLMLPEIPAIHQPATLITASAPWHKGQYATINIQGREYQLQLTSVRQTTGLFTQFQFVRLNAHSRQSHNDREHWEIDQDFTNIWASI